MLYGGFQQPVRDLALLAAVRYHFDLAHHDVGAFYAAFHARGKRQLEFAYTLGLERVMLSSNLRRIHGQRLIGNVVHQRKPVVGFQMEADVPFRFRVIVDRHG